MKFISAVLILILVSIFVTFLMIGDQSDLSESMLATEGQSVGQISTLSTGPGREEISNSPSASENNLGLNNQILFSEIYRNSVRYRNAASAVEMESAIREIEDVEPHLVNRRLKHLNDACKIVSSGMISIQKWIEISLSDFCENYALNLAFENLSYEEISMASSSSIEAVFREQVLEEMKGRNLIQRSDLFTGLLISVEVPEELEALVGAKNKALRDNAQHLWNLGFEEAKEYQLDAANVPAAQDAAILLFNCRKFGGCEAGSYYALMICISTMQCGSSISVEQYIYETTAPADYALAQIILTELVHLSSSR